MLSNIILGRSYNTPRIELVEFLMPVESPPSIALEVHPGGPVEEEALGALEDLAAAQEEEESEVTDASSSGFESPRPSSPPSADPPAYVVRGPRARRGRRFAPYSSTLSGRFGRTRHVCSGGWAPGTCCDRIPALLSYLPSPSSGDGADDSDSDK